MTGVTGTWSAEMNTPFCKWSVGARAQASAVVKDVTRIPKFRPCSLGRVLDRGSALTRGPGQDRQCGVRDAPQGLRVQAGLAHRLDAVQHRQQQRR